MKNPLVSVLMPAYNAEKYIEEAIESILNQTYKNFELMIIDDCSTDGTWERIKKYEQSDKRIIAYKNRENKTIPKNRNLLLNKASGKYIAWQDADDISLNNRLKEQVKYLEDNLDVGICGGFIEFFDEKGKRSVRKYDEIDIDLRRKIFRYSPVAQPVAMIRKEIFDVIGPYDEKYTVAQDLDMSFRIGSRYKFANIQKILLLYREHSTSISAKKIKQQIKFTLEIRKKYNNHIPYKMNFEDKINYWITYFVQFLPPSFITLIFNNIRNSKK